MCIRDRQSQGSPTVVLVPAWQKLEGYFTNVLAKQMGTSLFFATPRPKDVERRLCPTNTHTYTLFSSSFYGRFSPQISFCDPHPTVFLSFSFFLWVQTVPEPLLKPPYEPSCVDIQFYYNFKKTDIPLELPKDDQVLLLQGFNESDLL